MTVGQKDYKRTRGTGMGIGMSNIWIVMHTHTCRVLQMEPVKWEVCCLAIIQSKKKKDAEFLQMSQNVRATGCKCRGYFSTQP